MIEIIPVIHVTSREQALVNTGICLGLGVKKAFYINHAISSTALIEITNEIKRTVPSFWVGMNLLGVSTNQVLNTQYDIDAVWIDETVKSTQRTFRGKVFGGLAFKYQSQPTDLEAACQEARQCVDVATTSGPATGKAASVDKVRKIRNLIGGHPLALASGVTPENVSIFRPYVDFALVATSITDINEMLLPHKLKELLIAAKED
jgi:hypothetical protein